MSLIPPPGVLAPAYHPPEELLLDYVSGGSLPAEAMMIATHLMCCSGCRSLTAAAQDIGGALFDAIAPIRLPPDMLNRTLGAIERAQAGAIAEPHEMQTLSATLDRQFESSGWRKLPNGLRMRRVSGEADSVGGRIWLFDSPPGMKLLPHRHCGNEWTLILRGIFVDNDARYGPGDFACMTDGKVHRPMIGAGERCVSLVMVRQSPRYTTWLGKLSSRFVKL